MKQSRRTYNSFGKAALYFADKIYKAVFQGLFEFMEWIFIRIVISYYLCTIIMYMKGAAEELPIEIITREGNCQNSHWNFEGFALVLK